jgi:hypothetical protein
MSSSVSGCNVPCISVIIMLSFVIKSLPVNLTHFFCYTDRDGINAVYETAYNQALCFKRYESVKILNYYSNYPPPECMMKNSYLCGVQLAMLKAKGDKFLDKMENGINSLNWQI